jgi:hypothetical protein
MERFFDATNQEISQIQTRKGTDQEKNKNERMEERKIRDFVFKTYVEVPILVCSPSIGNTLMQPSLRRTHLCGNLPYNRRSC